MPFHSKAKVKNIWQCSFRNTPIEGPVLYQTHTWIRTRNRNGLRVLSVMTVGFSFCGASFFNARPSFAWSIASGTISRIKNTKSTPTPTFVLNAKLKHSFEPSQNEDYVASQTSLSDQERWERMYEEGERRDSNALLNMMSDADESNLNGQGVEAVRVITFDLDNTLWKTGPVISSANDALNAFMEDNNLHVPTRVEHIMGALFKDSPSTYNPSLNDERGDRDDSRNPEYTDATAGQTASGKASPVLLTKLRKDAIANICLDHNNFQNEEAEDFSERAFDVWTTARHEAIPRNFAQDVLPTLTKLRNIKTPEGHPIVIGAVTDGNSDPRRVPELEPIFDFCVNAEGVGVSKPSEKVYQKAIEVLFEGDHPAISTYIDSNFKNGNTFTNSVGLWWVHVGDDFIKDIVASKQMNMRSVWSTELIKEKLNKSRTDESATNNDGRGVDELLKEISSKPVVEMSIGTKDFLAETVLEEFVDARIERFSDLLDTITMWNREHDMVSNADKAGITDSAVDQKSHDSESRSTNEAEIQTVPVYAKEHGTDQSKNEIKFCIFCGSKNPRIARFCISCGESQPDLL